MKRGDIVRRKADPVHSGRVVRIDGYRGLVNVRWFYGRDVLEFMTPATDLLPAEDRKSAGNPARL